MHKIQNISHAGATTADILFFKCTIARHATQMSAFRYFLDRLKLIDIRCCLIPVLVPPLIDFAQSIYTIFRYTIPSIKVKKDSTKCSKENCLRC